MRYRFHTLDVFTDTRFGGNPLAVVLDADALNGGQMQTIAAEFNLSETVFVLQPAKAGGNRRKLRIFTPQAELPFAGHPTVGTGYLLAALKLLEVSPAEPVMVLEEGVGDVPVTVQFGRDGPLSARMSVPRMPERGPEAPPPADLAAMLSLAEADLLTGHAAYCCGVPFLFIPVRDRKAIARVKLRMDLWDKQLSDWWAKSVFCLQPKPYRRTRTSMRACSPRPWVCTKTRPPAAPLARSPVFCTTRSHATTSAAGESNKALKWADPRTSNSKPILLAGTSPRGSGAARC